MWAIRWLTRSGGFRWQVGKAAPNELEPAPHAHAACNTAARTAGLPLAKAAPNDASRIRANTLRAKRRGVKAVLLEIGQAVREMPLTMKQLALVKLFEWYAIFCYWQYVTLFLSTTLYGTTDATSAGFREAGLLNGQICAFYHFIAFVAAFALVPSTRRFGPKAVHSMCLTLADISMLCIPPENVLRLAGGPLLCGALAACLVQVRRVPRRGRARPAAPSRNRYGPTGLVFSGPSLILSMLRSWLIRSISVIDPIAYGRL